MYISGRMYILSLLGAHVPGWTWWDRVRDAARVVKLFLYTDV